MSTVTSIVHPVWGNNLGKQISAEETVLIYGGYKKTRTRTWYRGYKETEIKVPDQVRPATDDDKVDRCFQHRCELLRLVLVCAGDSSHYVALFSGHATSRVCADAVEFVFSYGTSEPHADIWFSGHGCRMGPLYDCYVSRLVCTFSTNEQMNQHLTIVHQDG